MHAPCYGRIHERDLSFNNASSNAKLMRVDTATNIHPVLHAVHILKRVFPVVHESISHKLMYTHTDFHIINKIRILHPIIRVCSNDISLVIHD